MCLHSKKKKSTNSILSAFMIPFIDCHFKFHSGLTGSLKSERSSLNLILCNLERKRKNSVFQSTKSPLLQYRVKK